MSNDADGFIAAEDVDMESVRKAFRAAAGFVFKPNGDVYICGPESEQDLGDGGIVPQKGPFADDREVLAENAGGFMGPDISETWKLHWCRRRRQTAPPDPDYCPDCGWKLSEEEKELLRSVESGDRGECMGSGISPPGIALYDPSPWTDLQDREPEDATPAQDAETGKSLWLHWCRPFHETVVLSDRSSCLGCGSRAPKKAPQSVSAGKRMAKCATNFGIGKSAYDVLCELRDLFGFETVRDALLE